MLSHANIKQTVKMLAPYIAAGIFWCVFENGWLTILVYHAQILLWNRNSFSGTQKPRFCQNLFMALPAALAGPLLYFLLPYITRADLALWLEQYHLSGISFMIMIPYFGLVHPLLEQIHWTPLREDNPIAHIMFAGYHILVLQSLLTIPWLILCFVLLVTASYAWRYMDKTGEPAVSKVSHIAADLGIIIAVWLRISG